LPHNGGVGWRERRRRRRKLRSKWLPGYWLRHPAFALVACALTTLALAAGAAVSAYDTNRLNTYGVRASATVLEVHAGSSSSVRARFTTADGRTIVTEIHDYYWDPVPREGDAATVVYDPDDPANVVRDVRVGDGYLGAWLWGGLALLFLVGGGVFFVRTWGIWMALAEAWRAGTP
jgi:hypothetical protein